MGEGFSFSDRKTVAVDRLEAFLTPMTPEQLITIWAEEKPWETPPVHPKGPKGWLQRKSTEPLVRSFGRDSMGLDEAPEYVKVGYGRDRQSDVRGWVLKKLGVPEAELKKTTLDAYEAQPLIAKGLGIPLLQAAILDHDGRNLKEKPFDIDDSFRSTLRHPYLFARPELF